MGSVYTFSCTETKLSENFEKILAFVSINLLKGIKINSSNKFLRQPHSPFSDLKGMTKKIVRTHNVVTIHLLEGISKLFVDYKTTKF